MRKMFLRHAILTATLVLSGPNFAWANEINSRALDLASQKKYEQALTLLSQQDASVRSGYEHRFLKARILSWSGQYSAAQIELDSLNSDFPENPDVGLALGNLAYYQSDLGTAKKYYQAVLDKYPDYQDARNGLENVRRAQSPGPADKKDWRIDGGASFTDLSEDGLESWNSQFLRAEYAPDDLAYSAAIQKYDRFGSSDIQFRAGLADAVKGGWDWGLEGAFTPDATFRPDFSLGGRLGKGVEMANDILLYPNLDYRYDEYSATGIHTVQPGLTAYMENGIVLSGRLIGTFQDDEDDLLGWLGQARLPLSEDIIANFGYASAPEAIDGVAITTQSYFGGLSYSILDDLDIHLNVAHDDRENSFSRNSLNVGFTHKR